MMQAQPLPQRDHTRDQWELSATRLLTRIIAAVTAGGDRDTILRHLCKELAQFFKVPQVTFAIWEPGPTRLVVTAEYVEEGYPPALGISRTTANGQLTENFLDARAPLVIEDVHTDARTKSYSNLGERFHPTESLLLVPLVVRGKSRGLLTLNPFGRRGFQDEEIRLCESVAAAAAQVLEIALLYQEAQDEIAERVAIQSRLNHQNSYLSALHNTALGMMDRLNQVELLDQIVTQVAALLGTNNGFIFLVTDDSPPQLELKVGSGFLKDLIGTRLLPWEGMSGTVWMTGEPAVIVDYASSPTRSAKFERAGFHSVAGVPLHSGAQVIGVLGVGKRHSAERFSQDDVQLLTRFAQLASIALDNARLYEIVQQDLLERKKSEETLHFRERSEKLLAQISSDFINLPPDAFDQGVLDALRRIGEFMGVDRSYLFLISDTGDTFHNTYEWCAEGIALREPDEQTVTVDSLPVAMQRLRAFEPLIISQQSDLPPEATVERARMERLGIRSLAILPMVHAQKLVGVFGLTSVHQAHQWTEEHISQLEAISHVLVEALEHMRNERILRESEERYRTLFAAAQRQTLARTLLDEVRTALAHELTLPDIFRTVVRAIADSFGYSSIEIYLLQEHRLLLQCAHGRETERLEHGTGNDAWLMEVVRRGEPLVLSASDKRFPIDNLEDTEAARLYVPLSVSGEVAGVLALKCSTGLAFAEDDLHLMEALAEHINIAIGRARLYMAARESEARYRYVVENIREVVFQTNASGRWLFLNPAWTEITGFGIEESLNMSFFDFVHPEDLESTTVAYEQLLRKELTTFQAEVRCRTVNGTYKWIYAYARPQLDGQGDVVGFTGTLENITERKRAAQFEEDHKVVLEMIARNESLSDVFNQLIRMVERASDGVTGSILLLHDGRLYHSAAPSLPVEYAAAINGSEIGPRSGSCGTSAFTGSRVIVSDIETDPLWDDYRTRALEAGLRSCWSVPIVSASNQTLGTFAIYSSTVRVPTQEELELLEMVRRVAAIALEQRQLTDLLAHQAQHDSLTGLPNRHFFNERLTQAINDAQRSGHRVGVLFIDLDRFKQINDTLGHAIGDSLLQQAAERLSRCIRKSDVLARMGGDEFTLMLTHIKEARDAMRVAQNLLDSLRGSPFQVDGHELYVSASIGISLYPEDGLDAITLQRNADSAMYGSKKRGRDNLQCFDPQMAVDAFEQLEMEIQLRRALERREFELHYQPIVTLAGEFVGMEALVRWNHAVLGLVPPTTFIPLAEETGLIVPIGTWILEEACRQASQLSRTHHGPIRVAVNVSAVQFAQANFSQIVSQALNASRLAPHQLTLELTEGILMHDPDDIIHRLTRLRQQGVRFAIDDFGTGYSSLSYLQRLPIDTLKIDKSFVNRVGEANSERVNSDAIIRAITTLGHSLGIGVLAEGLEHEIQLKLLREVGCDWAQGFFFARPMSASEIETLLYSGLPLPFAQKPNE